MNCFTIALSSLLAVLLLAVQISSAAILPMEYNSYALADEPSQPESQALFLADRPSPSKRAQTFVRFGKRAQTFVRFGKRGQTFVRFGRSAPIDE